MRGSMIAWVLLAVAAQPSFAKPRPKLEPLFIVSDVDSKAYLLGCARVDGRRTRFIAGSACASQLANRKLSLELLVQGRRTEMSVGKARFRNGSACPGPARRRYPAVNLDVSSALADAASVDDHMPDAVLVGTGKQTLEVTAADASLSKGIATAVAKMSAGQKVRAVSTSGRDFGPTAIALVDLDGNGTFEIVVRDTSLFRLYDQTGKRLPGEVGCYFGG